jgi:hypothetical protein
MFIHSVYFWLRDDLSAAQVRQFDAGLRSLCSIDSVRDGHFGVPASTDRPVIERGYSRALVLIFPDEAAHDAYQSHPVHERFRSECGALYSSIRIFDSVTVDR